MLKYYDKRRLFVILSALLLIHLLLQSCLAEVVSLPDEQSGGGMKPYSEFWLNSSEYRDPTIFVKSYKTTYGKTTCAVIEVRVSLPEQIRTYSENFEIGDVLYSDAETLAESVNAVAAVNGDFFQMLGRSLTIRQGLLYRESYNEKSLRDILIIDDHGDFYCVTDATQQKIDHFRMNVLPQGRIIENTFCAGPLLIQNGEAYVNKRLSERNEANLPMQRSVIIQMSALHYAIVACEGSVNHSKGLTLSQLTRHILKLFPNCRLAYCLGRGSESAALLNGRRLLNNKDAKPIGDILYFASAWKQ